MRSPRACVIGWPVGHSRSPLIHNYWLRHYAINGSYEKCAVPPDQFSAFLGSFKPSGFVGGNVTLPHKVVAAERCDHLSAAAARLGSVNTLWFDDAELHGDTTDGRGFVAALDEEAPDWDARKRLALVLGAGGAASPIIDALLNRGFERVVVANRTVAKAEQLADRLGCDAVPLAEISALLEGTDLLVNTTSAGLGGTSDLQLDLDALPAHAVVDDIVYVPLETALMTQARRRGLRVVGGLGMLLHQAIPGFARWFGVAPEVTPDLRRLVEADIAATV